MLTGENFSYALGSKGSTRRKLAAASGCIIEYVGKLACAKTASCRRKRQAGHLSIRFF